MKTTFEAGRDRPEHGRVGDELLVARSRAFGISRLNDTAKFDGELNKRAYVFGSFYFVSIKQSVRCSASDRSVKLPRKIGGVTKSRTQALSEKRRHLVRGIASEQQTIAPPAARKRGMKRIDHRTLNYRLSRINGPGFEHLVDPARFRNCRWVVARHQHELPAMPLSRHRDKGRRPRWIAILDRIDNAPRFIGGLGYAARRLVQDHVEHDPAFVGTQIVQRGSHEAPNKRPRAITADDIASGGLREFSGCEILVADTDVIAKFVERKGITAQPQIDGSETDNAISKHRLEFRLIETVRVMPTLRSNAAAANEQQ